MSRVIAALRAHARQRANQCAVRDDQVALSWFQLADRVDARVAQLQSGSVTRLAIAGDNCVDWLTWDLATLAAGIASIPLPPFFLPNQIDHVLSLTGANALATAGQLEQLPADRSGDWPRDTAKVTLTSGTTGEPKGVCLSQQALEDVATSVASATTALELRTHLAALPLAILLENVAGVYAAIIRGLEICLPSATRRGLNGSSEFEPQPLLDAIALHQANSLILVPEMLKRLLSQAQPVPRSLKFVAVGGARVGATLIKAARNHGLPLYEGYGLSECASVVSLNLPGSDQPGSAGVPLKHVKWRLDDGLLELYNPGFLGYLGGADADPDGWVRSGDEVTLNDGFLLLTGRRRNVFITSFGRNVSPEWPESELCSEPAIRQAIVFGEARPAPCALIEAEHGITTAELAAAVTRANTRLPDYARIVAWQRLPIPLSAASGLATAAGTPCRDRIIERYQYLFQNQPRKESA